MTSHSECDNCGCGYDPSGDFCDTCGFYPELDDYTLDSERELVKIDMGYYDPYPINTDDELFDYPDSPV